MKIIGKHELDQLSRMARDSKRLRKNLNLHDHYDDPCQRLFNALEPGTYIRPHRHTVPPKPETFVLIRGALTLLTFDDTGNIRDCVHLVAGGETVAIEVPPGVWHMAVARQQGTIFFEVKPGPYRPLSDKEFAPWAPTEESAQASSYLETLVGQLPVFDDSGVTDA